MGLDGDKVFARAERQLKAGRVDGALTDLRRLASTAPNDPSLLNRIGDLLARHRRAMEAIEYYDRASDRFARSGLYAKSIAVGKKILRLRSNRVETLARVGDWYLAQRLPGEARSFLLHAADLYLESRAFDRARKVYERLVEAEPHDVRHRARLAEALAAEGHTEEAAHHLLALASSTEGDSKEAVFRRAMELLPENEEPVLGLARVFVEEDREGDAIAFLEAKDRDRPLGSTVRALLAFLYDRAGRAGDALDALAAVGLEHAPVDAVERFVRGRIESGDVNEFWERFAEPLRPGSHATTTPDVAIRLLERLASLQEGGHLPALELLVDWREAHGGASLVVTLERYRAALERAGRADDEQRVAARIAECRGDVPKDEPDDTTGLETVSEETATARPSVRSAVAARADVDVPIELEAPAVPLNRSDEDFVAGRLTQAEILEKYGLRDQAIAQVKEVVARFPGHVDAQERLVRLFEDGGGPAAEVRDALLGCAIALRASGEVEAARAAARRASESAPLDETVERRLVGLGLSSPSEGPDEPADAETSTEDGTIASHGERVAQRTAAAASTDSSESAEDEIVIDFDDGAGVPGEADDARATVEPAIDDNEGDDLAILAMALESELVDGDDDDKGWIPEPPVEQSLDEVLSAFRERVQQEVGSDDFQTHYDLAIGYKEMGMLDEAVASFEVACNAPELRVESLILIAVIRREQGDVHGAVRSYRDAIVAASTDARAAKRLRYDLADTLEQAGEVEEALLVFREVQQSDPSFRDVQSRVDDIERRLNV